MRQKRELIILITSLGIYFATLIFFIISEKKSGDKVESNLKYSFILIAMIVPPIFFMIKHFFTEKTRREKIKAYCFKNNIEYSQNLSISDLPKPAKSCKSIKRGSNPIFSVLMKKKRDELTFFLFDYTYEVTQEGFNTKKRTNTFDETICLIYKPNLNLPELTLRDNEFNISNLMTTDIEKHIETFLKEDPIFFNKFHIITNTKISLDKIFNKEIRDGLKSHHKPGYKYEAKGDFFIVSQEDKLELEGRIELLKQTMDIFSIITNNLNLT